MKITTLEPSNLEEQIKESGWNELDFYFNLIQYPILISDLENDVAIYGKPFTPEPEFIFNGITSCPKDKFKVLFIGQDPYPQQGVADGISFSCSRTMKEQPSLRYIFDELQIQYPNASRNPDLSRWSKQGVLMLNTALTCRINDIGSHYYIWNDFSTYFLKSLNKYKGIVTVFLGKKAEVYKNLLPNHIHITVPHPASAAYRGGRWDSKNLFITINEHLKTQGLTEIDW